MIYESRGRWIKVPFSTSEQYWEERYQRGGDSGDGSYGRLATFKANILNRFIERNGISDVIEFGCGDGNQLSLLKCQHYLGIDVSQTAIETCRNVFSDRPDRDFMLLAEYDGRQAEMALSLDVIFHLIEDSVFSEYMSLLFNSSSRIVAIYSSNHEQRVLTNHVRHRRFTEWIQLNRPDFRLLKKINNSFPYRAESPRDTSFSDFYFFSCLDVDLQ